MAYERLISTVKRLPDFWTVTVTIYVDAAPPDGTVDRQQTVTLTEVGQTTTGLDITIQTGDEVWVDVSYNPLNGEIAAASETTPVIDALEVWRIPPGTVKATQPRAGGEALTARGPRAAAADAGRAGAIDTTETGGAAGEVRALTLGASTGGERALKLEGEGIVLHDEGEIIGNAG